MRRLDNLPGNNNLIRFLNNYLTLRVQEKSVNNSTEHVLKVLSHQMNGRNSIEGILQAGVYGFAADIEHLNTGRTFRRTVDDCEYLPFFFSIFTRAGQNEAILLLQRFGVYGTKSILEDDLATYIDQNLQDSRLFINPLITDEYIEEVIGGEVKSLTCVRYNVPTDVANDLGFDDHQEDSATMEIKVKAKRDRFLSIPQWMRDEVNGWQRHGRMIEVTGIEYNDVKLHIDVGGKTKTVKLSDFKKMRMSLDVTDEVQINADGHPTVDSLHIIAANLLPSISRALGWRT
jgi:hypothetical protein